MTDLPDILPNLNLQLANPSINLLSLASNNRSHGIHLILDPALNLSIQPANRLVKLPLHDPFGQLDSLLGHFDQAAVVGVHVGPELDYLLGSGLTLG